MNISNLGIYVENYNDWIDIQNYLFNQDISWLCGGKELFKNWSNGFEIIFPRYLMINSTGQIYNTNCGIDDIFGIKCINAKVLLRKSKLKKISQYEI